MHNEERVLRNPFFCLYKNGSHFTEIIVTSFSSFLIFGIAFDNKTSADKLIFDDWKFKSNSFFI